MTDPDIAKHKQDQHAWKPADEPGSFDCVFCGIGVVRHGRVFKGHHTGIDRTHEVCWARVGSRKG